jgi:2-aminobenzoate-CoA ligase
VSAGEHLPLATYEEWQQATGIMMIDGLGTTEMIHIFVSSTGENIRPGAIGKAVTGYKVCIFGEDDQILAPGSMGRLAVKGPTGCKYLADKRQKDYVINGWNVIGDICEIDKDGYIWYQGRADDMIISSGYNISGPEVEAAMIPHKAVAECAVVASPDPERGNIVKGFVVLQDGCEGTEELALEIQEHVKQTIAPYKYPRAIEFISELPKTLTGKIQRHKLRESEAGNL